MGWLLISISFLLFATAFWQWSLRRKAESDLKTAREQIHSREHKIQTILDNAPIVFSAVDTKGIFHISEGKGLEKLGRKSNQSIGLSIFEMHNQNPIILDAVRRALSGEQVVTSFTLKGIAYDLFMGPERDSSGTVTGATMLSVDITDRKRMEEEKARLLIREQAAIETSKLKSEFLATMSHEIRTPINGVLGMTSLLLDTSLTPQQKEYTDAIKHSGAGLLSVINDILDFSKIEAGKLDFEAIDFELPELLRHMTKGLGFTASQKGIVLKVELAPQLPMWVKGDPGRFRQILNNLIGNAIKFTEKGHVLLRVRNDDSAAMDGLPSVLVEVEDTGIGISKAALGKMFVAFSQAEASMSRRYGGTGLGLSIAKQLVEKMGGELGVKSEEGKGSVFWFRLPFAAGQQPPIDGNLSSPLSPSAFIGENAPKILVAEDNRINQIITVRMLEKMGLNAIVVADGFAALDALKRSAYDLVLMDCQMPKLDGLEASRRIRAGSFPLNHGVPILAMTANAMKGDKETCLAAGMNDYVSKPVSYEELSTVVTRWLEVRHKLAYAKAS